jgi:transcriptional regulator with XRE-family HTH domain
MWAQSASELGKVVAAARRHRRLTQAQLARSVGATQTWISQVEQGKDTAQVGKILRLLSYLDVRLRVGAAPWIGEKALGRPAGPGVLADIIDSHSNARAKRSRKT